MPAASRLIDLSTRYGRWPPTSCVYTLVTNTYTNGLLAQCIGSMFSLYNYVETNHEIDRINIIKSNKVYIEGNKAIRICDNILCSDTSGQGSPNFIFGG